MSSDNSRRSLPGRDDKAARQRIRGVFILVFGLALAGLGLFVAPWGLLGTSAVNGLDVSRAVATNSARSAGVSALSSGYIGHVMIFLPFVLAGVTGLLALARARVLAVRWTVAGACILSSLLHALAVRDTFASTAGYGSWMVGAGYLVLGYGCVVVARATIAAQGAGSGEYSAPSG